MTFVMESNDSSEVTNVQKRQILTFNPVPQGIPYLISGNYEEESGFGLPSAIVSLVISPHTTLDFLQFLVKNDSLSFKNIFYKATETQPTITVCCIIGLILAGIFPLIGIIVCICRHSQCCKGKGNAQKKGLCFYCAKKMLRLVLGILILLLISSLAVVISSNESFKASSSSLKRNIQESLSDLETYFRNSETQIKFLVANSLEQTVKTVFSDLNDVEYVLGRPLQKEFAAAADIETVVESLLSISNDLRRIFRKMRSLDATREQALTRQLEVSYRLRTLHDTLLEIIAKCPPEDELLCQTLNVTGQEMKISFQSFSFAKYLAQLSDEEMQKISETARKARYEFARIPSLVTTLTEAARQEVKWAIKKFQSDVEAKMKNLDLITSDIQIKKLQLTESSAQITHPLSLIEQPRWIIAIGASACLGTIVFVLSMGFCCGCCLQNGEVVPSKRTWPSNFVGQLLVLAVFLIFLFSPALWILSAGTFFTGAHAHGLACLPLYEKPQYHILEAMFDANGVFFPEEGFWSFFLTKEPEIKMRNVLNRCDADGTAYKVFEVEKLLNVSKDLNLRSHMEFTRAVKNINVNITKMEFISAESEKQIHKFLQKIELDITPIRRHLEQPLTKRDIQEFAKQIESVATQIESNDISSQLFRHVAKYRSFITTVLFPLQKRKEDLTFQLATLDTEIVPLQRQIKQSSSRLRKIQEYIHKKGLQLVENKVKEYSETLSNYGRRFSDHVEKEALFEVAKCTPVWEAFVFSRDVLCDGLVGSFNTLWIGICCSLVLFIPVIVVALKLSQYYLRFDFHDDELRIVEDTTRGFERSSGVPFSSNLTSNNLWVTSGILPTLYKAPTHHPSTCPHLKIRDPYATLKLSDHFMRQRFSYRKYAEWFFFLFPLFLKLFIFL